ncbi:MAG: nucleotide exchange factor GrpE [Sedimentisphaerales bacterium]|nr:nucleotide exchange factor GrpE [Sedimentisphaerales bacterium]
MKQKKPQKPKESAQRDLAEGGQEEPKAKKSELEKLRQQTEDLQKEKDELFGKLQRVSADYTNFQKRSHKQIAESVAYEREKIIKALLPALDNLEHTLQNAHAAENTDALVKGIQIIYDQMFNTLKTHGVEQIKALDEKFDAALHEAIMQRAEPEREENIVLEEFQKGYKLNGRVIRPSRVIVNKPASKQEVSPAPASADAERSGGQQEQAKQEQATDESTGAE